MLHISEAMKKQTMGATLVPVTFEDKVNAVIEHIQQFNQNEREEPSIYAISRIVAEGMKPSEGWRHKYLNRAYGTFFYAAAEFYRRVIVPHEE